MADPLVIEEVRDVVLMFRGATSEHADAVVTLTAEHDAAINSAGSRLRNVKSAEQARLAGLLHLVERAREQIRGHFDHIGMLSWTAQPDATARERSNPAQELRESVERGTASYWGVADLINRRNGFLSWLLRLLIGLGVVLGGIAVILSLSRGVPALGVLSALLMVGLLLTGAYKYWSTQRRISEHYRGLIEAAACANVLAQRATAEAEAAHGEETSSLDSATRRQREDLDRQLAQKLEKLRSQLESARDRLGYQCAPWNDRCWKDEKWPQLERLGFGGLFFDAIATEPELSWSGSDSRDELRVAIGSRGGFTRYLRFGDNADQHVLVLGRRSSGKTTLLHVLITNLCLSYSPREVELCLLDFGQAHEFEAYAAFELPHAPVIGIGGNRQFGVEALRRLDGQLSQRLAAFDRESGISFAEYRASLNAPLQRIVVVMDDVRELFVEDDDIARESGEILERLLERGGAVGIHLVLTARAISGALALPSRFLPYLGTRLVLACPEPDARLALQEDAAVRRLLCWPGEAAYRREGTAEASSEPFHVAWIDDAAIDSYAGSLRVLAHRQGLTRGLPVVSDREPPFAVRGQGAAETRRESAFAMRGPVSAHLGELVLAAHEQELSFPGLFAFPGEHNLLIKAPSSARGEAFAALHAIVLRLIATIPAGKLHLTLIDRVGQSRNLASFMELSEFDEDLVNRAVWTDERDIERELSDLERRIALIHQKYLRQEYRTIDDYNAHAGEVAEPYRLLVITGFPSGFTEQSAKVLETIVSSGPTCGVYTFMVLDTDQKEPRDFQVDNIMRESTVIAWHGDRFVWATEDVYECSLTLDRPPEIDTWKHILRKVGERAQQAGRVEVPFSRVAAQPGRSWNTASTREGITVPIGRIGARKNQLFDVGKGTAQHALLLGKTGSGKSTLLHVLITNLALTYNPNELHLYLVDFKEGVEFKSYAEHRLPHARVIAIESEREFGLSVLERLANEVKVRGETFRAAGAQNIIEYRKLRPDATCPRILLVVDEFQTFFAEDDEITRRAGEKLDELARQGRAFGIHMVLASQTLRGNQTLHGGTAGQIGVRIAMQCHEDDARTILSDDNPAARLLSRPGEAIYNAENGHAIGNSPFQTVWMTAETRSHYLEQVTIIAGERGYSPPPATIFEGAAPGDIRSNEPLETLLAQPPTSPAPAFVRAWLGDPIAIKSPTEAHFRQQSSSNLLIVGQREEAALGIMVGALTSIAGHFPPRQPSGSPGVCFYVLDFTPTDAPHAGTWERVRQAVPYPIWVAGKRDLPQVVGELAAEVSRRLDSDDTSSPPAYLLIYGLQRARDLRSEEDSLFDPMSSLDAPAAPNPAKQFPIILREGPEYGIHTIVWCDTMINLNRTLDRRSLREFDMRVVFQMSADDSGSLIDSQAASKLGPYRAILYSEEEGNVEKFRPYGLPETEWIDHVHELLNRRAEGVKA